jgi:hypothetical protein
VRDSSPEPEPEQSAPLYVDIAQLLAGGMPEPPAPVLLRRQDGHCLFYARAVNVLFGDPESGKSWVALAAATEALRSSRRVLMIDADHNGAHAIVSRLLALGAPGAVLGDSERFRYAEPDDREHLVAVIADAKRWRPAVAVVDSIGEVLPLLGMSSNSPDDYTTAHRQVLRPLKLAGAAVIAVDHLAKNAVSRGFGPTGTAAKRRTFDGASIRVTLRDSFAPGRGGCCALSVNKDRHGGLRRNCPDTGSAPAPAGLFRLAEDRDGRLSWSVSEPSADDVEQPEGERQRHDPQRDAATLGDLDRPPASVRDVKDRMGWGTDRASEALGLFRERSGNSGNTGTGSVPRSYPGGTGTGTLLCAGCGEPMPGDFYGDGRHATCQA